ncbi:alpha/beta hydrolase [Yinghuangia soli]|uniref:Acyl-CoA:diacylglycerol acyltransferase n=1 Tax=Yinghuangia soli TaxID=2908204 RepID=A0AA41PX41_9ACTN|nr:alpha/beta hydrolase family protein [Yinghuangia soli]MCF2527306.1 esterase family protein [Yinghuangia soli]
MPSLPLSRRSVLKAGGALALGGAGLLAGASQAHAASNGFGLQIIESRESDPRLKFYRFKTAAIGWLNSGPAVNVLLPEGYETSGKTYPVLYLHHGGNCDYTWWEGYGEIRRLTAGLDLVVVMPDGGRAGWYCNPVSSFSGARNWEDFHMTQLLPWVEANFRVHAEFAGRAVAGFSMGGFGALKYTAKYYGHFSAVSSYSGPADIRGQGGILGHWINLSSMVDLNGGMVYGVPWAEARVSADNPCQNVDRYRGKRIFMSAGDSTASLGEIPFVGTMSEAKVLRSQQDFGALLTQAGIPNQVVARIGGQHDIDRDQIAADLAGVTAHLRSAL